MVNAAGSAAANIEELLLAAQRELSAAKERERLLQSVFDHTYQFIGVLSLDGIVLEANRSALALIGANLGDIVGRHFAETPWWSHSPALQERLREALGAARARQFVRFEATHVAAGGALHHVDFSVKPIFTEHGEVSHLVCEGRDITDRRRAEEALRDSRSMLELVLDTIPVRVFWKDRDSRYLGCNASFARDAGVDSIEDVIGKHDFDFGWRAQAELYRGADARVISSGTPLLSFEEPQTSPKGEDLWLRTSKIPLRNAAAEVVGVLGVYEDISERKREEKLRIELEVRMQQAQKLQSLGLLAASVAHDFNNLLAVIVGNLGLLRDERANDAASGEPISAIGVAAQRANDLCRQLLAYSGGGQSALVPVDINATVREMSALLRISLGRNAQLKLVLDHAPLQIDADATQLRQVVMNLITNASDALGEAGGEILVRTSLVDAPRGGPNDLARAGALRVKHVLLEVADAGCGMDGPTLKRIFEPFYTTKASGHGLGLAAVLGIVEAHHGVIEVDSQLGRGTHFRLLFPANTQSAPAVLPFSGRGRVLLVDDDPGVLVVGAKLLGRLGFDVETVNNGRDAMERYEPGVFSLAIVDLTMPHIDGLEVTRGIRAKDSLAKVILTSGYDVRDVLAQLDRIRPDGFLAKPFSLETLGEALSELHNTSDFDAAPPIP